MAAPWWRSHLSAGSVVGSATGSGSGAPTMVRLFEEGLASPGEALPADPGQPFPRALLADATCPEAALAKVNRELRMLIDCKRALDRKSVV